MIGINMASNLIESKRYTLRYWECPMCAKKYYPPRAGGGGTPPSWPPRNMQPWHLHALHHSNGVSRAIERSDWHWKAGRGSVPNCIWRRRRRMRGNVPHWWAAMGGERGEYLSSYHRRGGKRQIIRNGEGEGEGGLSVHYLIKLHLIKFRFLIHYI